MLQPYFFFLFFFWYQKDAGVFDLFLHATSSRIFTLWDKLVTLYECISIRLQLQWIKRYVVAVCLMHHMCPCSFRCRYVFMFRFESFYSSESGWKCRSELQRFVFWIFMYRMFAEKNIKNFTTEIVFFNEFRVILFNIIIMKLVKN